MKGGVMGRGGRARERGGAEHGFTLVELLIVIVVLGIVSGALGSAFVVSTRSTADVTARFNESHDAQIASAYLATDVQSATAITANQCYPDALTNLINFSYDGGYSIASYYYGTTSGEKRVVRRFCDTGGNLTADTALVSSAGSMPTVTCTGGCDPSTNPRPNSVKFAITESDGYAYSLSGSRRSYAAAASPPASTAFPPLLALGSSGTQIAVSGNGSINVNGGIIVNSTSGSAVSLSGNASIGLAAGSRIEIVSPGTCSGCPGGLVIGRTSPVPDPLVNLPAPSTAGLPINPAMQGNAYQPGIYTGSFSVGANESSTFAPGVYILQNGFNMSGNSSLSGTGVLLYLTGGSFSVTGNAQLTISPPAGGTYAGISIWQDKTDTNGFLIAGNGSGSAVNGVLYLPTASPVTLGSGNGSLVIGAVIASHINPAGNGSVCIGYPTLASCP